MSSSARPVSWLLSLPAAVLAVGLCAVPAHTDPPPGDPGERGQNQSSSRKADPAPTPPGLSNGKANNGKAKGKSNGNNGNGKGNGAPQEAPPAGAGKGAGSDQAPPPHAQSDVRPSRKVVVCKYVRKPGEAEVYSHVIVVSANALLGKGFDGSFPYPFSDGQFNSVAIRFAEKGESAREVGDAACPATSVVPEEPGTGGETGGESGGGVGGEVEETPQVGGLVEEGSEEAAADEADGILPATGSSEQLALLAGLGGLAVLAGLAALLHSRRKQAGSPLG